IHDARQSAARSVRRRYRATLSRLFRGDRQRRRAAQLHRRSARHARPHLPLLRGGGGPAVLTTLALAIATKGEWNPDRLLDDLRSAGAEASTEIHVACDSEHAPSSAPNGLTVHRKASASLFELWGVAIAACRSDWVA